ncbi:hypothetical protein ACNKHT_04950 [Shigella flexneri]
MQRHPAIDRRDNSRALQLAEKLRQQGCWVTAIRPPTVPLVLRDCA